MNELEPIESKDLSVRFSETSVQSMKDQRDQLNKFVSSQMVKGVDYGVIPGTPKPSLFKPGAEKLCKIFQLGSRIVGEPLVVMDRNPETAFAMFTYTVEIFHIPSNKAISQCQGSANSNEKKYKTKPIGDLLNTLQKMAQKRAHVGAVISATGASDFFTQDLEDLKGTGLIPDDPKDLDPDNYVLKYGRAKGKALKEATRDQLEGFVKWFNTNPTPITAPAVIAEKELVVSWLNVMDAQPPKFDVDQEIPF